MNGEDTKQMEKLFDAKLKPIAEGVTELKGDMKRHGKKLTELDTKFKYVGNCAEHKADVDIVKKEVDRFGNRIWALVILIIGGAGTLIMKALYWDS